MHIHVSHLTGLPARTQLRSGEWRCFLRYDAGHHKAFACVNTADYEILDSELSFSSFQPPYWDIWSSAREFVRGSDRESFYQALQQYIPAEDPQNDAAYKFIQKIY